MVNNEKKLKRQSLVLSSLVAIIICLFFLAYEYAVLKKHVQNNVLPAAAYKLNNLAFYTQNQFQFMQFTSIYHDIGDGALDLKSQEASTALNNCLDLIIANSENLQFTNRKPIQAGEVESYDGALLGRGDVNAYSDDQLNLLCTILRTAPANSESLRLVKDNVELTSLYYFISKDQDFMYLYNTSFNQSLLSKYTTPTVKKEYELHENKATNYWITKPYTDLLTKKTVLSLVKNVINYQGDVVGFIARDFYALELSQLFTQTLIQTDSQFQLFQYAEIEVINDGNIIYHHDPVQFYSSFNNGIMIESTPSLFTWSDFGPLTIRVHIPRIAMYHLMLEEHDYLLLLPFFIFVFTYLIFLQLLRGFHEGDKQYFDMLTETYNRNGLHHKVFKKIDKMLANKKSAHIFSLDANRFKQINDKYGHEVGDRAIQIIARSAKHISKPDDDVIRLGGDEFLVVLYIDNEQEFDSNKFMERLNEKIAYDCRAQSLPQFTVSAGYVVFDLNSHQTLSQIINHADTLLLNKKSIEKIATISEEFDSYGINLSENELEIKLSLNDRYDFIENEHLLQSLLNQKMLHVYQTKLNYLMSNYFKMMYSCTHENDDLHHFRMKIVESHYQAGIPMSVFYFLFIKYATFLFREVELTPEEVIVNNRVLSYELHFISNLKMR